MYMPSALPCSTTLVSPPTTATPACSAARAMARTSASNVGVGRPASSTKLTTIASGLAPETARSFTVPLMASSPIEPPGKLNGFTTKLSVVIARRTPPMLRDAASFNSGWAEPIQQRSEQAFDQATAGNASGAVGHFDLRLAKLDLRYRAVVRRQASRRPRQRGGRCLPMFVTVISCARSLRGNHQRPHRMFRRAFFAEQLALRRLQNAFQHFATLRRLGIGDAHAGHAEALLGIPLGITVANAQAPIAR